jgi:3-oxoacyl-[acyl-carrier protein] reductase
MSELKDKVIVITGGGSGLGKEMALLFAREGAHIAICGRRQERLEEVVQQASQVASASGEMITPILSCVADVSDQQDVKAFLTEVQNRYGRLDVLINNAAVYESYQVADMSLESWLYQMNVNATGAFLMTKASIPLLRASKQGKIISITSSIAASGGSGFSAYGASKTALEILMSSVDDEESAYGITACSFEPGVMKTELQSTGAPPAEIAPYVLRLIQTDRRFAGKVVHPEDIS